jgi:hypothetical protein
MGPIAQPALAAAPHQPHCKRAVRRDQSSFNSQKEPPMAQATTRNQLKIMVNQRTIVANQKKILRNQENLKTIVGNQIKIIRNQQAIVRNQKKIMQATRARARAR